MPSGRPERPPQSDLASPFEHRDDHHVGDPDAAHQEGDGSESEQQVLQVLVDLRSGFERIGRPRDLDLVGITRVDRARQDTPHVFHEVGAGSQVDRGRHDLGPQKLLGSGVADHHGAVDVGIERQRFEDPDHSEAAPTDPNDRTAPQVVDPEPLGSDRPEYDRRKRHSLVVEEASVGHGPLERVEQLWFGGQHVEAVLVVDILVALNIGVELRYRRRLFDGADPAHHGGRLRREFGALTEQVVAGLDLQQVGAELVDLGDQIGLAGTRDAEHGDHRGDPDRDSDRRQQGTTLAAPQPVRCRDGGVARQEFRSVPRRTGGASGRGRHRGRRHDGTPDDSFDSISPFPNRTPSGRELSSTTRPSLNVMRRGKAAAMS